jgi:methylglyoxal synthase
VGTEEGTAEDEGAVDDISEGVEIVGALLGAVGASEGAAEIVGAAVVHSFSMDSIIAVFRPCSSCPHTRDLKVLALLGLTTIWAFLFVFETATGEFSKQRTRVHLRENPQCFQWDNCPMQ